MINNIAKVYFSIIKHLHCQKACFQTMPNQENKSYTLGVKAILYMGFTESKILYQEHVIHYQEYFIL